MELLTSKSIQNCDENEEQDLFKEQEKILDMIYNFNQAAIVKEQRVDLNGYEASYSLCDKDDLLEVLQGYRFDVKNGCDIGIEKDILTVFYYGQNYTYKDYNDDIQWGMVETKVQFAFINDKGYERLNNIIEKTISIPEINRILSGAFEKAIKEQSNNLDVKKLYNEVGSTSRHQVAPGGIKVGSTNKQKSELSHIKELGTTSQKTNDSKEKKYEQER